MVHRTIEFEGVEMNVVQVSKVVEEWFDEAFSTGHDGEALLQAFIQRKQEATDYKFLMYNEADMSLLKNFYKRMILEIEKLQYRDFHTDKFQDQFYYEN